MSLFCSPFCVVQYSLPDPLFMDNEPLCTHCTNLYSMGYSIKSRLVTQCEYLCGFRNQSGRGENDAIVTKTELRSLLCHSRPTARVVKPRRDSHWVTNRLRKFC